MIEPLLQRFEGAYAEATLRAYRADFADYERYCQGCGADPLAPEGKVLAR